MTKVLIRYNEKGEFLSLEVKGHANAGKAGSDLVCAGISAVILGGINNIQENMLLTSDENQGYILLKSSGKITDHDAVVIETIIRQLEVIANENPKHLKISSENR